MNETSKALKRRNEEQQEGKFNWERVFRGRGIDIGCGPDKLPFHNCEGFDIEEGDANRLSDHFQGETFDYIHSSQCLEHMQRPSVAFENWLCLLKPNGYAVTTVPDWCLYEGMIWPSRYNPDHKSTWSLWLKNSPAPTHILVPSWLNRLFSRYKVLKCELIDTQYDYNVGAGVDQTLRNAEAFIEFVIQKPGRGQDSRRST